MNDFIMSVAVIAAVIVFAAALTQGKGFWNAVRMGVGVLILGIVAVIVLGVAFGLLKLTMALLIMALWMAVIFGIIVVVAKVIRGAA